MINLIKKCFQKSVRNCILFYIHFTGFLRFKFLVVRVLSRNFIKKHPRLELFIHKIIFYFLFFSVLFLIVALIPIVFIIIHIALEYLGDYLNNLCGGSKVYQLIRITKISFISALAIVPGILYKLISLLFHGFVCIPFQLLRYISINLYSAIKFSIDQGDLYLPYKLIKEIIIKIFSGKN